MEHDMKRIFLGLVVFLLFAGMAYSQQSVFTTEELKFASIAEQAREVSVSPDSVTLAMAAALRSGINRFSGGEFKEYILDEEGRIASSLFTIVFTKGLSGNVQLGLGQIWRYVIIIGSLENRSIAYPLYVYWPADQSVTPTWYALIPKRD
jgi:hypothetical protein